MDRARILALVLSAISPAVLPAPLARIDRLMQQYVDSGKITGAVGLVLHNGKVVYQHAAGWSDLATHRAMTPTTQFIIASQTNGLNPVVILALTVVGKHSVSHTVG